jgi:spermidine/putrescine transport system ATP-binding protein
MGVVKTFGEVTAVKHVSIDILSGEFFSILGPSGCGKTSMLRLIAGLEEPTTGSIYLEGKLINSIPPYRRNVNTVFQNYALFPHMNVYENIAFGLKMKKTDKAEISKKVPEALNMVDLSGMALRKPKQLSGGQQQRVALARALVNEPSVLLLDEPLGALDLKLRKQMQIELKSLQKRLGITFIYVTHDQEEALTMSDRIAVMNSGQIEQIGTPSQIYENPETEFVASFIGISNLFTGYVKNGDGQNIIVTTSDNFDLKAFGNGNDISADSSIAVMVRPERIQISALKPEGEYNIISGIIEDIVYLGVNIQFIIDINGRKLIVIDKNNNRDIQFKVGQEVFAFWDKLNTVILSGKH